MPEPVQRPATDDQLRLAADRAVGRWIEETDRALRDRWDARPPDAALLADVATEERRRWWTNELRRYAHDRIRRRSEAARAAHRELGEQLFARLRTVEPRPNEREFDRPSRELQQMLSELIVGTAAGAPLAAESEAIDAALPELAARAAILDDLRFGKSVRLTQAGDEMAPLLAQARQIAGTASPSDERGRAKALVMERQLAAFGALEREVPDLRRAPDESDRALLGVFAAPLIDQCRALGAPFDTARAAAVAAAAALPGVVNELETASDIFESRFGDAKALARLLHQMAFYGPTILFVLCRMKPASVPELLAYLEGSRNEAEFRGVAPADVTQAQLLAALRRIENMAHKMATTGYQRQDRINSAQ